MSTGPTIRAVAVAIDAHKARHYRRLLNSRLRKGLANLLHFRGTNPDTAAG